MIERPAQPKGRVRWLTFEEAEQLVDACSPHLRPLVMFLLGTGARMSEALYLEWREVDLAAAHVTFLDTKNGEHRGVPLHARLVNELRHCATSKAWCSAPMPACPTRERERRAARSRRRFGGLPAGRDRGFQPARLPPHLGDVALRGEPGHRCPDEARRLEVGAHGAALCPR